MNCLFAVSLIMPSPLFQKVVSNPLLRRFSQRRGDRVNVQGFKRNQYSPLLSYWEQCVVGMHERAGLAGGILHYGGGAWSLVNGSA